MSGCRFPIAVILLLVGITFADNAAANPVTWVFVETSCSPGPPPNPDVCHTLPPDGLAVARLALQDLDSSAVYHFSKPAGSFLINESLTGTPFTFTWPDTSPPITAPVPHSDPCFTELDIACEWDLSFVSSSTKGLGITIHYLTQPNPQGIDLTNVDNHGNFLGLTSGTIGTEGALIPGCGGGFPCQITGVWYAPEPPSVGLLLVGLLGLLIFCARRFAPAGSLRPRRIEAAPMLRWARRIGFTFVLAAVLGLSLSVRTAHATAMTAITQRATASFFEGACAGCISEVSFDTALCQGSQDEDCPAPPVLPTNPFTAMAVALGGENETNSVTWTQTGKILSCHSVRHHPLF